MILQISILGNKKKKETKYRKNERKHKKDYFLIKRYVNVASWIGLEQEFLIKIEKEKY